MSCDDDTIYFQFPGEKFLQKLEDGTPLRGTAYQLCGTEYNVIKLDLEVDFLKQQEERAKGTGAPPSCPPVSPYKEFDTRLDLLERKLNVVKDRLCAWAKSPVVCEQEAEDEGAEDEEEQAEGDAAEDQDGGQCA